MTPDLPGPLDALTRNDSDSPDSVSRQRHVDQMAPVSQSTGPKGDVSLVEVDGVSLAYSDATVLDGVSLSVASGEFVGLVGPNGAGKTTLLKTINSVLAPDSGSVRVGGEMVETLSSQAASRLVATVPQDTTVAFEFSVEDVVEMGRTPYHGRVSGDADATNAVERALERTETTQFRDRSVASLSGGERQRVVLARALAQETPALLLDEPTASLDVNHQVRTLELVRELVDTDGKAALAAIHDLDLAARFCDRLAVLADGDLLAVGPPETVLTREHLGTAFDTDAAILPNPATGTPVVTPLPSSSDLDLSVHVVGTGPATARTIAVLSAAGANVTVGAVPSGDVAATTAQELAAETVTAPPFATLDADVEARARDLLVAADVVALVEPVETPLQALARDHDTVVRVAGDVESGDGQGGGRETPDWVTPGTVLTGVRRALDRAVEADD